MDEDARLHPTGSWPVPSAMEAMPGSAGLLRALPEGWVMLGRCRTGTAGPAAYPTGCFALAHPTTGIALVDVAPDATPNAESRLRRALGTANFWPAFPGYLPVWHGRIELAAWRSLPGIMAEGFSELPPLTVAGKAAWIAAVRTALAEDAAWEIPGAARRAPRPGALVAVPSCDEEGGAPAMRRSRRGWVALALGFTGTFALGVVSGVMLLSGETPSETSMASLAVPPVSMPAAVPALGAVPPREATRPPAEPAVAGPVPLLKVPAPAPAAMQPAPPATRKAPQQPEPSVAAMPPVAASPVVQVPEAIPTPDATGAEIPEPSEAESAELPLPPVAPKAPVKAVRPPARIDRACSQAQYRFQQGLPLTAAEVAHLRDGCATQR